MLCEQNNRKSFNIFKILNLDLTKNSGGQVFFMMGLNYLEEMAQSWHSIQGHSAQLPALV